MAAKFQCCECIAGLCTSTAASPGHFDGSTAAFIVFASSFDKLNELPNFCSPFMTPKPLRKCLTCLLRNATRTHPPPVTSSGPLPLCLASPSPSTCCCSPSEHLQQPSFKHPLINSSSSQQVPCPDPAALRSVLVRATRSCSCLFRTITPSLSGHHEPDASTKVLAPDSMKETLSMTVQGQHTLGHDQ